MNIGVKTNFNNVKKMNLILNIKKIIFLLDKKQKISIIYLFILMFISMILETFSIGLILPALTLLNDPNIISKYEILNEMYIFFGKPSNEVIIIYLVFVICIFYLLKTICVTYVNWRQLKLSFGIQVQLSKKLFKNYLKNDYSFHFSRNSANLIRNITTEIDQFGGAITASINLIAELLIVFGICLMLILYQPVATIFLGSSLALFSLLFYYFTRKLVYSWGKQRQLHQGKRIQYIQQGIGAVKQIKLSGREENFVDIYAFHNEMHGKINMLEHLMTRLPRYFLELIAVFCLSGLIILLTINQSNQLIPIIGLFAGAAFRLLPSVSRILGSAQGLRYTLPSTEVLFNEFKTIYQTENKNTLDTIKFNEKLELKNLSFRYKESLKTELKNINLKIKFGDSIGFIGKSGAGKSTLMDLVLGLIEPFEGSILVDGHNIKENLKSWQSQIGYVPQEIYMMDDSLAKNIAMGLRYDEIDFKLLKKAINLAQLDSFIESLPMGIDTEMGERGIRLSGGQLQRIGIARALYNDPKVLIFDEASSALDNETEKKIMHDINKLKGDKTILIIAHRLSTLENCDKVFKIDNNNISI